MWRSCSSPHASLPCFTASTKTQSKKWRKDDFLLSIFRWIHLKQLIFLSAQGDNFLLFIYLFSKVGGKWKFPAQFLLLMTELKSAQEGEACSSSSWTGAYNEQSAHVQSTQQPSSSSPGLMNYNGRKLMNFLLICQRKEQLDPIWIVHD